MAGTDLLEGSSTNLVEGPPGPTGPAFIDAVKGNFDLRANFREQPSSIFGDVSIQSTRTARTRRGSSCEQVLVYGVLFNGSQPSQRFVAKVSSATAIEACAFIIATSFSGLRLNSISRADLICHGSNPDRSPVFRRWPLGSADVSLSPRRSRRGRYFCLCTRTSPEPGADAPSAARWCPRKPGEIDDADVVRDFIFRRIALWLR